MNSQSSDEFTGTDRFEVIRRLGAGGMGVVYEAYDRERQARVALKTLHRIDARGLYQFKQEFRSLAEIVHPALIPLYELISDGDRWFFTMSLVEGGVDILSYLRSGPVKGEEALPISQDTTVHRPPAMPSLSRDQTINRETAEQDRDPGAGAPEQGRRSGVGSGSTRLLAGKRTAAQVDFAKLRQIFAQLVEGVQELHRLGLLHRDLKPANVLVDADGRVVVLDFGLVIAVSHREASTDSLSPATNVISGASDGSTDRHIAGTIAYMSPEQAAAEPLTEASDWYAVGGMLYEAITGRRPFVGNALWLLKEKTVREPPSPAEMCKGVPEDLNSLCVDLLRRNHEARPKGPEVLARLAGALHPGQALELARSSDLPFIGRERHLAELNFAFERTEKGEVTVCNVQGRSGAGKTALIECFLDGLTRREDVLILTGRCYEQESVPYKGVDSLVDALTRYLLRLDESELKAVTPVHVAALTRIFPVLCRVPLFSKLSRVSFAQAQLEELRRRAFEAFRQLLTGLGDLHTLVLYIDDLQWGDVDSAELLSEVLRPPRAPRLMLLLSYRAEYLQVSPCLEAVSALETREGLRIHNLEVGALTTTETRQLALDLIGRGEEGADGMADWVVRESAGSAYFVYELVRHLRTGMDPSSVEGVELDEVLWNRVQRLHGDARCLLEVIAVAGQPVRLRNVQEAAGLQALTPQLVAALRSGHLIRSSGPGLDDEVETYHDRIRESVTAHLGRGSLLRHHEGLATSLEAAGDALPEVLASHFLGAERPEKAGYYFESAADQSVAALALERAESYYQRALALAASDEAKGRIYEKLVHYYTDLARFEDAFSAGRKGTELFGVKLPARFIPPLFFVDVVKVRLRLGSRRIADIAQLPTSSDDRLTAAIRLMAAVGKAAYQIRAELCIAVLAKLVNLCLKNGNTRDSAIGYMAFGSIFLGGVMGNHRAGYEFGRLALKLVEKYDNRRQRAEVHFVVGYFGTSWLRPAAEAERLWKIAYDSGLETGDLFHTGCACSATVLSHFLRGVPFPEILEESEKMLDVLRPINLREPIGAISAVRQAIRNLIGETSGRASFNGDGFDEERYVQELKMYGSRHLAHFYFVAKMQTLYLWGELGEARRVSDISARYLKHSPGMLHSAEHHVWNALILMAELGDSSPVRRWFQLRKSRAIHRKLCRWASECPENFRSKERVVAGEICRVEGDEAGALKAYKEAIAAASESGHLQIEALACHQTWKMQTAAGKFSAAQCFGDRAVDAYRKWGATGYAEFTASKISRLGQP